MFLAAIHIFFWMLPALAALVVRSSLFLPPFLYSYSNSPYSRKRSNSLVVAIGFRLSRTSVVLPRTAKSPHQSGTRALSRCLMVDWSIVGAPLGGRNNQLTMGHSTSRWMRAGWGTRLAVKRRARRASLTIARPTKPAGRETRFVTS